MFISTLTEVQAKLLSFWSEADREEYFLVWPSLRPGGISAISDGSHYVVLGIGDYADARPNELKLWDVRARRLLRKLRVPERRFGSHYSHNDTAFSRDGRQLSTLLAPGSPEGAVMWDVPTRRRLRTLGHEVSSQANLAVSGNGTTVAISLENKDNGPVELWQVK